MAHVMTNVMTQPNSASGILRGLVDYGNSTVHDGMVQERPGTARMTEHASSTSDRYPTELKYIGMKAAGGAAAWYFIPAVGGLRITCHLGGALTLNLYLTLN